MIPLVVGCPVNGRAWVLSRWAEYVEKACEKVGIEPVYAFAGCRESDPGTFAVIDELAEGRGLYEVATQEPLRADGQRDWGWDRFVQMAEYRNGLLRLIRELSPQYFLSLDSDILLHPDALGNLIETMGAGWGAVGGKAYMAHWPSYAMLSRANKMHRPDFDGVFQVHVIMAIKLMSSAAYHVDYTPNKHGEDIGFALNCREAGVKLAYDARVTSRHVMYPNRLNVVDPRCGF